MNILVHGYGKMGKIVAEIASTNHQVQIMDKKVEIDAITSVDSSLLEEKTRILTDYDNVVRPDLIIDFSERKALPSLLEYATDNVVPLLIATTSFTKLDLSMINDASRVIPICLDGNYSKGFWLFEKAVKSVAKQCDGTARIHEVHHLDKQDAPSGSAMRLAKVIQAVRPKSDIVIGTTTKPDEIGIVSERYGEEVGTHTVRFDLDGEEVVLTHRATSREIFAHGAIKIGCQLVGLPFGLYRAEDFWEW